jgi:hypothetical protein
LERENRELAAQVTLLDAELKSVRRELEQARIDTDLAMQERAVLRRKLAQAQVTYGEISA